MSSLEEFQVLKLKVFIFTHSASQSHRGIYFTHLRLCTRCMNTVCACVRVCVCMWPSRQGLWIRELVLEDTRNDRALSVYKVQPCVSPTTKSYKLISPVFGIRQLKTYGSFHTHTHTHTQKSDKLYINHDPSHTITEQGSAISLHTNKAINNWDSKHNTDMIRENVQSFLTSSVLQHGRTWQLSAVSYSHW
jgi:hypothetical protein